MRPLWWCGAVLLLGATLLTGCARTIPRPVFDEPSPAPVTTAPEPAAPRPTAPARSVEPAPDIQPPRVVVLVSDDAPQYVEVRDAIAAAGAGSELEIHELRGDASRARALIDSLASRPPDFTVGIGLLAGLAAKRLTDTPSVFCQVFNHSDHDLLGGHRRGVTTIPDLRAAIEAWKSMDASLSRVAVITGTGHEDLVTRASREFARFGIELVHSVSHSDKETVLEFQRVLGDVDGFWMLPDNRVLSRSAIRELMALARSRRVGVLVNDPRFLAHGALLSAASPPDAVARSVFAAIQDFVEDPTGEPEMHVPDRSLVEVNVGLARELALDVGALPAAVQAR